MTRLPRQVCVDTLSTSMLTALTHVKHGEATPKGSAGGAQVVCWGATSSYCLRRHTASADCPGLHWLYQVNQGAGIKGACEKNQPLHFVRRRWCRMKSPAGQTRPGCDVGRTALHHVLFQLHAYACASHQPPAPLMLRVLCTSPCVNLHRLCASG